MVSPVPGTLQPAQPPARVPAVLRWMIKAELSCCQGTDSPGLLIHSVGSVLSLPPPPQRRGLREALPFVTVSPCALTRFHIPVSRPCSGLSLPGAPAAPCPGMPAAHWAGTSPDGLGGFRLEMALMWLL